MDEQQGRAVQAFLKLLARDAFEEAKNVLKGFENEGSFWQPLLISLRTDLLIAEGDEINGLSNLTDYINSGQDVINGCLNHRAGIYFDRRQWQNAKRDYQAVLDSRVPHAVTYFHATAAFRLAWMLALEGSPKYEAYLARSANLEQDFLFGRLVGPRDVQQLYEEQRARRDGGRYFASRAT